MLLQSNIYVVTDLSFINKAAFFCKKNIFLSFVIP